ncbi:MAG TPA: hypothetical protein VGQ04_06860 [Chitinophagaceae bacterium]|jgi:hypothetical protein|nr:hypothetical protein [Chitinophagaceae bacterium]
MTNLTIEAIYTKQDEQVPEYLIVVFNTNQGLYQVGYGHFYKAKDINLGDFVKSKFLDNLQSKYGILEIVDLRVTYDNDMYFLISNKFLLVLGFTLSSTTEHNINEFWVEEDIYDSNRNALDNFFELDKVALLS